MDYLPFIMTVWDETNARMKAQEVGGGGLFYTNLCTTTMYMMRKTTKLIKRTCFSFFF